MRALALATLCLVGCGGGGRRSVEIEFTTGGPPAPTVDQIAAVGLEVWSADGCACVDLDTKPGCMAQDREAQLSFVPGADRRVADDLPEGALVVRATALDAQSVALPLRVACWCTAAIETQTLVFPLGSPLDPAGRNCR